MSRLLDGAFKSDDISWLPEADKLPEFSPALRKKLYDNPDLLHSPSGVSLLCHILKDSEIVDLSPFSDINIHKTLHILQEVFKGGHRPMTSLILPDMKDATSEDLTAILYTTGVSELHLGEMPQIGLGRMLNVIDNMSIETFTCSALYRRAFDLAPHDLWRGPVTPETPSTDFPCGQNPLFPLSHIVYIRQL